MQWSVTLLISALLVGGLGCTNPKGAKDASTPPPAKTKPASSKPAKNAPNAPPVIEPVTAFSGRVVLVNGPLKYIVVEGTLGRVPAADQSLNVYRDGQKVGVVIVSNQSRGANFAADLAQGEVRVGDTVRSD
ncbi:MAG: hypothetical protein EBS05_04160 [Proteobacteria bacterium]|jgi:hypothetical protein|nr:hypothetical protein [Pseudomonadota bacterium]